MSVPKMVSIRQAAERAGVSQYYLRGLCRENRIVYRKSGVKHLVNWDKLEEYLSAGDKPDPADTDGNAEGNIRALT